MKKPMNYILFEDESRINLLPLTFTRPLAELRTGILTIREKWEKRLNGVYSYLTEPYLSEKYNRIITDDNVLLNSSVLPDKQLVEAIKQLATGEMLKQDDCIIAARLDSKQIEEFINNVDNDDFYESCFYEGKFSRLRYTYDIFLLNGEQIAIDFELLTEGRKSAPLSATNNVLGMENIFLEEGAVVEFATLNAKGGYIYIGKDAEIMEGSIVRGSLAMCEQSVLKIGAKIYGPTTIGPYSKVGGEVNNTVITGFSNKAHDGFLGNAVLGEWCNIGADSNNSNLKNNYAPVRLWNYDTGNFARTGLQFCGLIMGDHSKCGINTMFNTGTVIGVSANIFGAGFPRNFVPSFAWGGPAGFTEYNIKRAFEVVDKVMSRRNIVFDDIEKRILEAVFEKTRQYRNF